MKTKVVFFLLTLWLFRLSFLVRMRDSTSYDSIDSYAIFQIIVVICLFTLTFKYSLNYQWDILNLSQVSLFGMLLSIFSVSPFLSFYRSFEVLTLIMVTTYLIENRPVKLIIYYNELTSSKYQWWYIN